MRKTLILLPLIFVLAACDPSNTTVKVATNARANDPHYYATGGICASHIDAMWDEAMGGDRYGER